MKYDLLCVILKILFLINNRNQENPKKLWEIKYKKYYSPLFRYYRQYITYEKEKLSNWNFCRQLLLDESKKEITLIPRLAAIITTRCTLKCKKCAGLFPYFDLKQDISYSNIIRDIKAVEQKVNFICCLELVGGESFLHPNLDILLKYAKNSKKIGMIEITTNAVVKISKRVLNELSRSNVLVLISDYGFNRENVLSLIKLFRQRSIKYKVLNQKKWTDFGLPQNYGGNNRQLEEKFMRCFASALCKILYKGKILTCGRGPFLYEQGLLPNQYIDVLEADFCASTLYAYYTNTQYTFCEYCNYENKIIRAGEQIDE